MKKIEIEIPDGKRAEWVNGVLTLVDDKPIEYKFKVGDKVKTINGGGITYIITKRIVVCGCPAYELDDGWAKTDMLEIFLELFPQDITERIKTFEDAVEWCEANGKGHLSEQWDTVYDALYNTEDFDEMNAYMKLRIITCALNEGWEPSDGDRMYAPYCAKKLGYICTIEFNFSTCIDSYKLVFKARELAIYAAEQFRDIYADFCGCKKGGEA